MKYIISIFFLLTGFYSTAQIPPLNVIIDDYIQVYKKANFEEKLIAITISANEDSKYFISDISRSLVYGAANKLTSEKQNFILGVYKGIFCEVTNEVANRNPNILKPLSPKFFKKADKASKVSDKNGKVWIFDLALTNYEPQLVIIYDYLLKMQEEIYIDGRIVNNKL
jgi:hypothetical protein